MQEALWAKILVGIFLMAGIWGQIYLAVEDLRRFRAAKNDEDLDLPVHRMVVAFSVVGVMILGLLAFGLFDWMDGGGGVAPLMGMIGKLFVFGLIVAAASWFAPLIGAFFAGYLIYRFAKDGGLYIFPAVDALLTWTFGSAPKWLLHAHSLFWIAFGAFAPFYERFGFSFLRRRR